MIEKTENNSELTISGKFVMLPNEALSLLGKKVCTPDGRVLKLDGDDLVWWGFFFTFLHQEKPCYQTRKTISERFDCDERTVSRRTARLEELGLLTIENRKGTSSIYTATSVEQLLLMRTDQKVTPKGESDGEKTKKQPVIDTPETSAPVAGVGGPLPVVDVPVDVGLSGGDDAVNASTQYTDEQLRTKLRKWRNWGLDEEAKAFCLSRGVSNDEDSMKLFIQNYLIPVPASVEQQVNGPDVDHINCEYSEETQEEEFQAPF